MRGISGSVGQRRRELALAVLFCGLVFAPFLGKAYHNDEPFFLAAARHILSDPLHPLDFVFTWFGRPLPAAQINTTPPLLLYLLALAWKLTGGEALPMRLAFLPLDLAAAAGLYLLAARFLKRPLLPTLVVIASPAYLINMGLLMPEKPAVALGIWGLYALVRGVEDARPAWYWASAGLLGLAMLAKYNAAVFLLPALGYALHRGMRPRLLAAHAALALCGPALLVVFYWFCNPALIERAWSVTADSAVSWWSSWPHKLRSFLAFTGGCGVVTVFWPYRAFATKGWGWLAPAGAALLFLPFLDLRPLVAPVDRLTGVVFACGAAAALAGLFGAEARARAGWALWAPWVLGVALLQVGFYWSVMSRCILLLIPPLVFAMAEALESRTPPVGAAFPAASLAAVLAVSLCLAAVDFRYAAAQKSFAEKVAKEYIAAGRRVWFSGYMGLQHYLERSGGLGLDASRGGWDLARPGDAVVVLGINTALQRPPRPRLCNMRSYALGHPIPLRLMSGWSGEAGFYSNVWGFLPYSLSREPLEVFSVVELR